MSRNVTVGLDGSPESRAAAEWAAREAQLRGLPLRLLHVREPAPARGAQPRLPAGAEPQQSWTDRMADEAAGGIRLRHPGVEVAVEQVEGPPAERLTTAAKGAELLVLGSRGLSALGGFLVGSVGLAVAADVERPVVFVRAREQAADEHAMDPAGIPSAATAFRPVVLGLDADSPNDAVLAFAFEEAARRGAAVRAVHAWDLPPYYAYGVAPVLGLHEEFARQKSAEITEALRPWRLKYPDVEVVEESRIGSPAGHLIDASHNGSLLVVGRRTRRGRTGARIGSVTHAVLHHAAVPVAVVAHG
ncbi:universal stress protein [Streptomyces oryzae]|uniref:Universal stress protein n=1 Tax=Streptomyces oryzae TaxID=1434886 RepID=A0ABS3X9Z7_9ACTN|nr:universal stress protein [Streptomyces oryzae]MBO8192193.1 universal stress protein [Streptomyces oryzae]